MCDIVAAAPVAGAATQLLTSGLGGGLVGGFLATVTMAAVKKYCPTVLNKAIAVVRSLLATARPPDRATVTPVASVLGGWPDAALRTIAAQLGTKAALVRSAREAVCVAFRGNANAAVVAERFFPNASTRHLDGMTGFVRATAESCRAATAAEVNFLSTALMNLVLANTYQGDRDPPAVLISRTSASRTGGGRSQVGASFRMYDKGGIRGCDVLLDYQGRWQRISPGAGCQSAAALVAVGSRYRWAFRASDRPGHASQWVVTGVGTA